MSYVQLTRAEFEDWLNDIGFRGEWQLKPGKGGVYQLFLSPAVAIEINSTTGSGDAVMERGQASMSLRLVSRINGKVLNKKAMGQSHFARTVNWRDNWKKGVERMKDAYVKAKDFYDTIASVEDYPTYQREMLALIESKPNWQANKFFAELHERVQRGGVLSPKQREALERPTPTPAPAKPTPPQDDPRLQALRQMFVAARADADGWTMDFLTSIANQIKAGRNLSPKQEQILQDKARKYHVRLAALVGTDTATVYAIAPEQLRNLIDGDQWLDYWIDGSFARADQMIQQHGGAVFHTGGDGFWDVDVDGAVDAAGYTKPYGTPEFETAFLTAAHEVLAAARNAPLTPEEKKALGKANVWVMDWEMDGGTLPPHIQKLSDLRRALTPAEARVLLDWFYKTAPGNY